MTEKLFVLDDGFVQYLDHMGNDLAVIQGARTSYQGHKATEQQEFTKEDAGLLRYLMRHKHWTPFELVILKIAIRMPMDVMRQFVRHRLFCLSRDSEISFDLPSPQNNGTRRHYKKTIKSLYDSWNCDYNQTLNRQRIKNMQLRSVNEDTGEIYHTRIIDIIHSGRKPILKATLDNGMILKATKDHRVWTNQGWMRLQDAVNSNAKLCCRSTLQQPEFLEPTFSDEELVNEKWKKISGYNEAYEVSDLGRVRSFTRCGKSHNRIRCAGKVKKQTTNPAGYKIVSISKDGKSDTHLVNRLVLNTFKGDCENQSRHIDNNPKNNRLSNLKYGTVKDNAEDRVSSGYIQALTTKFIGIQSCENAGEEDTYDIEVEGPFHNFFANGVVVHNSINEYSTRYKPAIDSAMKTKPTEWRMQSENNKQGSNGFFNDTLGIAMSNQEEYLHQQSREIYEKRLAAGMAREQARKDLPLCTYTEAIVECDLRGWLHFLSLRMDPHAQLEIRQYANAIGHFVAELFPVSWQAFEDYNLNALTLTACELQAMNGNYEFPTKRESEEWKQKQLKYPWLNTTSQ